MFSKLKSDYVVGWRNIIKEKFVGESFGYTCDQTSVGTTNGAGPHNVQLFMLSPDLVVLNVLPGFWHPEDLARELDLGKTMLRLWKDKGRSRAQKDAMFTRLQLSELKQQPKETYARSGWQGFDARNEQKRLTQGKTRDTFKTDANGELIMGRRKRPVMKTTNVVVHERMAKRPFVKFEDFDTAVFADYGRTFYDNNKKVDGRGEVFMTPRRVEKAEKKRKAVETRRKRSTDRKKKAAERRKKAAELRKLRKRNRSKSRSSKRSKQRRL